MGWTMHSNEEGFGLYHDGDLVASADEDKAEALVKTGVDLGMPDPLEVGYDDAVAGLSASPSRHGFTGRGYDSLVEMYHQRYDVGLEDPDRKQD